MPSRSRDLGWRLPRSRSIGLSESQVRHVDLRRRIFLTAGVAASPDPTSTSVVSNNIRRHLDVRMTNRAALVIAPPSHIISHSVVVRSFPFRHVTGAFLSKGQYVTITIINPSSENRQRNAPK